jgi:uncharacterized membrane protein (DUF4010 family)
MTLAIADPFINLTIALGLGLLVGLERETAASQLGGLRTFPLVTVLGFMCALLMPQAGGWLLAAALVAVALLIVIGNYVLVHSHGERGGITTEAALLVMLMVGALLATGAREIAIAVGGGTAVLLQAKSRLKGVTARLGHDDVTAIMRFALIALVILPALPNRPFGPFDVLNLYEIWMIVVLIVGISLAGYIVYKFFGQNAGVVVGGILGGVISSTATTVSYAKRTKGENSGTGVAAVVIVVASSVVLIRVLIEIAVVAPRFLAPAAPPLLIILAVMAAASWLTWRRLRNSEDEMPEQENPTELRAALVFALLYALVLLAVAWARQRFGAAGLYTVSALAGLTDVDAITLSTAKLVSLGHVDGAQGWRLIAIANISNLVFKVGVVAFLGSRQLLGMIAVAYTSAALVSAALIAFWPA